MWNFNPRAPCGARPGSEQAPGFENCISIHAPRAGRDIPQTMAGMSPAIFQSTRPVRGATGERSHEPGQGHISIHAPRAGRDHLEGNRPEGWTISIHAPRAGRDKLTGLVQGSNIIFQSTRPVRGATPIFPRCGVDRLISIHAPRAGRDAMFGNMQTESTLFQSTRPVRGATYGKRKPAETVGISIHAPRAGRDIGRKLSVNVRLISIHAPRAGRDSKSIQNYFTHFCDKRQFLDNFTQNAAF